MTASWTRAGGLGRPQGYQRDGWREDAACRGRDPADWYSDRRDEAVGRAKGVCAICPVRAACSDYAVSTDQRWRIWGGLMPHERTGGPLMESRQ